MLRKKNIIFKINFCKDIISCKLGTFNIANKKGWNRGIKVLIVLTCSLPKMASSGLNWKMMTKLVMVNASQEWISVKLFKSTEQL